MRSTTYFLMNQQYIQKTDMVQFSILHPCKQKPCKITVVCLSFNLSVCQSSIFLKGGLSGLTQFLTIESPLKMMKNAFYFTSKSFFVLKMFKFLSWLFGQVAKRLEWKDKVDFKFLNVTAWLTNNRNTQIAQYLKK